MSLVITTGDTQDFTIQLTVDGDTFFIDPTADIHAAVVSWNKAVKFTSDISQASDLPGADWSTSLVTVRIPGSETAYIPLRHDKGKIELQVSQNSVQRTWFIPVTIEKGNVDTPA